MVEVKLNGEFILTFQLDELINYYFCQLTWKEATHPVLRGYNYTGSFKEILTKIILKTII